MHSHYMATYLYIYTGGGGHVYSKIMFAQVASSDWMLGVQIQNFENYLNAERKGTEYCCCDEVDTCNKTIKALDSTYNCTSECQTYFVVSLLSCTNGCAPTKTFNFSDNSASDLSLLVFQIPSEQSSQIHQVRNTM